MLSKNEAILRGTYFWVKVSFESNQILVSECYYSSIALGRELLNKSYSLITVNKKIKFNA